MAEFSYSLTPVEEKPPRRYRKGSKYDPIIDEFMAGTEDLVAVDVEGKAPNYVRTQLKKRIEARRMSGLRVSVVNDVAYLERE